MRPKKELRLHLWQRALGEKEWPRAEQGLRVSGGRVGDGAKHGPEPRKGSGHRGPW